MESPGMEEEEEDWEGEEPTDTPLHATAFSRQRTKSDSKRVIVHLDMDCFYAQVEMIRNPELRDKPLGVQQKYLMVTCNYVARECGVNKCMSIKEAKEKCPQLVLVSGEDLTHYREMSYKVTELLEEFGVKVERLGFDENFVDITELVDKKLQEQQNDGDLEVSGHVYNDHSIGYKTAQRLVSLGLSSICALQSCPITVLEKEFGSSMAHRIQQLSQGEDDSPVTPSGPPQSLSEEDSFKKCSTVSEVKLKIEELLRSLLNRLYTDGRSSHTLRLTLRQFSPTSRYFNRESRQCPIPKNVIQNLSSESSFSVLMELLMKLFEKMIDVKSTFHLTLLNVCFSNLKPAQSSNSSRNSIGFYLTQKKAPSTEASQIIKAEEDPKDTDPSNFCSVETDHSSSLSIPDHIDMDVFSQLPEDIRKEILSSPQTGAGPKISKTTRPSACPKGIQSFFMKASSRHPQSSCTAASSSVSELPMQGLHNTMDSGDPTLYIKHSLCTDNDNGNSGDKTTCASSSSYISCSNQTSQPCEADMDCAESGDSSRVSFFPSSVDMNVFSQLPEELQKELMADWKHKELTPKIPAMKLQEKAKNAKGQRPKSSAKLNNLLKYFKPG
ncbi:DNA polymerase iota isoform X2 [Lithobates pipiens]